MEAVTTHYEKNTLAGSNFYLRAVRHALCDVLIRHFLYNCGFASIVQAKHLDRKKAREEERVGRKRRQELVLSEGPWAIQENTRREWRASRVEAPLTRTSIRASFSVFLSFFSSESNPGIRLGCVK